MGNTRRPKNKTYPVRRPRRKEPARPKLFGMKAPKFRHTKNKYQLFKDGGCMLPIVALVATLLTILLLN
jgi:hypothetical protein